jgi:hypothetical protein
MDHLEIIPHHSNDDAAVAHAIANIHGVRRRIQAIKNPSSISGCLQILQWWIGSWKDPQNTLEDVAGARLWEATRIFWHSNNLWRLRSCLARPSLHPHSQALQRSLWGGKDPCSHCINPFFHHWDLWCYTPSIHSHPFSPLSAPEWNGVCSFPLASKPVCLHPCRACTRRRELQAQEASSPYCHPYERAGLHYGRSGILAGKIWRGHEDHSKDEAMLSLGLEDTFRWRDRRVQSAFTASQDGYVCTSCLHHSQWRWRSGVIFLLSPSVRNKRICS